MNLIGRLNRLFRPQGLELIRLRSLRAEYTRCYPFAYETLSPWFDAGFDPVYQRVRTRTVVTEDRCYVLRQFARQATHLPGDFAECGVYRGGTARLVAEISAGCDKRLHLFDTFEGMPETADSDPSGHRKGDFGDTSLESVRAYLAEFPHVELHQGFIPETFARLESGAKFSFVHVDVDLYQSVADCCRFFYDRLVPGGYLVFDDYGFLQYREAARRAVDEFFADRPEVPVVLRSGQCFVVKL